jgi:hypothetical protein
MKGIVIVKFRLSLSNPDRIITINQRYPDGRTVRVPVKARAVELELIDASFCALAKQCPRLQDYLQCATYLQTIQAASDSISTLTFSKSDLENLINGFELTKGARPDSWVRCLSFLKQLDGPEQIEDEIKVQP